MSARHYIVIAVSFTLCALITALFWAFPQGWSIGFAVALVGDLLAAIALASWVIRDLTAATVRACHRKTRAMLEDMEARITSAAVLSVQAAALQALEEFQTHTMASAIDNITPFPRNNRRN